MKTCSWLKRCPNLYGIEKQAFSHPAVQCCLGNLRMFAGIFLLGSDVALMQGAHEHEAKEMGS